MTPTTLRSWRLSHNLTRAAAALLFGISVRTLEGIEQDRYGRSPLLGPIARIVALMSPAPFDIATVMQQHACLYGMNDDTAGLYVDLLTRLNQPL
jgi:transcriptional regulator with XRE-family HTH domain